MRLEGTLLIESTCNQVNQFGGYTGMTPHDFASYLHGLAAENGFPLERLLLGGDHLGPSVWQAEPAERALQKAQDLIQACVHAGYTKIHLDASMRLGGDDLTRPLGIDTVASRTARMARAAERACADHRTGSELRYVIGSEVPPPGGSTGEENTVSVTRVEDARLMLEATRAAFVAQGLESAWERVIALVVQPGVEFGTDYVIPYQPELASGLARFAESTPFVYEAHSTDYQTAGSLQELVRDHFAILKVGPALTFAFREAVFALAMLESELVLPQRRSHLIERLDGAMQRQPAYWLSHYRGTEQEKALARKYSLSDRVRYYWAQPEVQAALDTLLRNLGSNPIPFSLLSQFLPRQYALIRDGRLANSVPEILVESIQAVLRDYSRACQPAPTLALP